MNLKKIMNSAKELTKKTIEKAKDPEVQAEITFSLMQKGMEAAEMANKAKESANKALEKAAPLVEKFDAQAENAIKTGRKQLGNMVEKLQNRNKGPRK